MTNYWRQFAEWVTELRHDLFFRTRFKLMIFYVLTLAVLLEAANLVFNRAQARGDLTLALAIAVAAVVVGYFLSGIALRPIKSAMLAQKRFIADASHELRTPLSIMKTNSEVALLEGENLTRQDMTSAIKSNLEEIDRMSHILQNLLNISQSYTHSVTITFNRVNLAEVAAAALRAADRLAAPKKIRLNVARSDSAIIWGNETALEEMILNLLKNAIFYTPEGGLVTIWVKSNPPENIELMVKDTGIGISTKDLPHIFEPFYKADKARIRRSEGISSGLGLTIVREIVKKHKGSITVQSAVGKGTMVSISFPADARSIPLAA